MPEEFRQAVAKRFQELRRALAVTQSAAADMGGTVLRSWQSYERGDRLPGAEVFAALSNSGVNVNWLLTGQGSLLNDRFLESTPETPVDLRRVVGPPMVGMEFLPVRRFDWIFDEASGKGRSFAVTQRAVAFNVYWLQQNLGNDLDGLFLCEVFGDAMEPLMTQGDMVLFHQEERSQADGLYVIVQDNRLRVRRLQFLPGNRLRVASDNKAYEAFDLDLSDPKLPVKIIGPAFWILKRL